VCVDVGRIERMICANFGRRICSALPSSGLDPCNVLSVAAINLSIVFFVFAFCQ
jgi:hypothetical protein